MTIPDATGDSTVERTPAKRISDLEHDFNLLRELFTDILTANSILRREFEEMTERNIKLVKKVNEFLARWTVA